jgi:cytochrome d ubiquinol oxidase subunit I
MDWEIAIPHLSALILTHEWNGHLRGLDEWAPADRPPVEILFWSFRIMVGLGFAMVALGLLSLWARYRRRLYDLKPLLWAAVVMAPSGLIALLSGWVTTEVGRQPYTIYGMLRTTDSVSPIGAPGVAVSLAAFVVVYVLVFGAGIILILRQLARPPEPGEPGPLPAPSHAAGITPGPVLAAE